MLVLVGQKATVPTTPTISTSNVTTSSVEIDLTTPSSEPINGVLGYDIEISLDAITYTRIATVVNLPYIVSGLLSGTTYRFRARGVDAAGDYRSQISNVAAITTTGGGPPPPTRRYFPGWCISVSPAQSGTRPQDAPGAFVGIPNGGTVTGTYPNNTAKGALVSNAGPVSNAVASVNVRFNWGGTNGLDNGDGTYNWAHTDAVMAQARALNVGVFFVILSRTFSVTVGGVDQNPAPADLVAYSEVYTSGSNTGYQLWRWSPHVLQRFAAFIAALGARYNGDPNFAGVGTQETATGGANGGTNSSYTVAIGSGLGLGNFTGNDFYTPQGFTDAILMESKIIAAACPNARHLLFQNFISGTTNSDATAKLLTVAVAAQPLGTIWCCPDLVTDQEPGNINGRVYPNYPKYANGTGGVPAPGITAASIQPAEWTGGTPAQTAATPSPNPYLPDLYNWMTSTNTYPVLGGANLNARDHRPASASPSPLTLAMCLADWHTTGNPNFTTDLVPIMAAHPTFSSLVPNP